MEAHAHNEWPLGKDRSSFRQHATIEERAKAAHHYIRQRMSLDLQKKSEEIREAAQIPFVLDSMENEFNTAFGAWPEVYLVISPDGVLLCRTEAEDGSGATIGGSWHEVVEAAIKTLSAPSKERPQQASP